MNSALGAKGETPPNMWPWFGAYQQHGGYQGQSFPPFGHQGPYYPYYPGNGMQFGGPQQHQHQQHQQQQNHHHQQQHPSQITMPPSGMKQFVHGGSLLPFNQQQQQQQQHQQQQQQQQKQNNTNMNNSDNQNKTKDGADNEKDKGSNDGDMPPLPPGPPPPSMMRFPPTPNSASPSRFPYQPNGMTPVKFTFGHKLLPNQNQQQQNQQQQHHQQNQQQQQQQRQSFGFQGEGSKKKRKRKGKGGVPQLVMPPAPPHVLLNVPPPLPPGPPPPSSAPPPPSSPPPDMQPSSPFAANPRPMHQSNKLPVNNDEWPQSLKDYIDRSYKKCNSSVDKDRVEIIIKGKIFRASADETLWTKDWDNEPLPLLQLELDNVTLKSNPGKSRSSLSSSLESRLGSRKSFPQRTRSSARKNSDSPPKRRRDRSWSSSSSSEEMKPLKPSKASKAKNFKNKNKAKQNKLKSHFYSEFGGENEMINPELLEKRAARFSTGSIRSTVSSPFSEYQSPLAAFRASNTKRSRTCLETSTGEFDLGDFHVVGVCQDLEKPYLRLTAAPDASAVRPPEILKQSLARVKDRWINKQDYHYACEQLKSIRQDLTVQGIRDPLTVDVYETHARIALEKGDHAEFNQCQSQLRGLYTDVPAAASNRLEFTAYRILYFIFTKDFMDLS
ncbi:hypothetical protein LSTR_LSTR012561 [Laodelphax striatellus]|uniref:SAC3/GANP/THP3 conserved domain-containing protein n=1 Tax=Laodelphax striatellus TaxID=195883 RepID=A0A482XCX1_LAOST|nr:hypothetical protein LSTR_LSTR012561 [Laodelphax striatellus]